MPTTHHREPTVSAVAPMTSHRETSLPAAVPMAALLPGKRSESTG